MEYVFFMNNKRRDVRGRMRDARTRRMMAGRARCGGRKTGIIDIRLRYINPAMITYFNFFLRALLFFSPFPLYL